MLQNEEINDFYSLKSKAGTFYGRRDGWGMRNVQLRRHIQGLS